ncbi:Uncharacterised protein [Mycobacteroides abscessus subsp. massiliense]|nr:Uncharacterised protein [Mycobacteroides abscessus subsp. abscessus]SKM68945.1 Uncharacterised protein [Mycobacteroides abscessus subsp. massiliense]SIL91310.1 Uncharacterised protein [Mycobacteroides abscessus subsp. abscessus]SKN34828.1 Uncharacterised protein [Mycobacteroides abscessus subsp. massiliense]SKP16730.1 Uncharacterised protein [Mycobacteroides abscessus subsp. massiliense]
MCSPLFPLGVERAVPFFCCLEDALSEVAGLLLLL